VKLEKLESKKDFMHPYYYLAGNKFSGKIYSNCKKEKTHKTEQ
jgi:hypothetical protein